MPPLLHQYQGFFQTHDLWAHAPQTAPIPLLLPPTNRVLSPSYKQLQHWQKNCSPKLRIGRQVEYFLQYYLYQQPNIKQLQHSLQIITEEKKTLGELDFLYYETQKQQWYHLEQCFKFYLYDPTAGDHEYEHWIGAHRHDSLAQKLHKLLHHQFPLLYHPATQPYLTARNISTPIQPQLSYKAALFLPYGHTFPKDSTLNPACLRGYWLSWSTFLRQAPTAAQYYLPNKQHWAVSPAQITNWQTYTEVFPTLKQALEKGRAPLCWLRLANGHYVQWWLVPWATNT